MIKHILLINKTFEISFISYTLFEPNVQRSREQTRMKKTSSKLLHYREDELVKIVIKKSSVQTP